MLIYLTLNELSQGKCKNRKKIDLICLKAKSHLFALMFLCLCLLFCPSVVIIHHFSSFTIHHSPVFIKNLPTTAILFVQLKPSPFPLSPVSSIVRSIMRNLNAQSCYSPQLLRTTYTAVFTPYCH